MLVDLPHLRLAGVSKKYCKKAVFYPFYLFVDCLKRLFRLKTYSSLRRYEFWALQDIDLEIYPGECLGIIGPNGAGKSTLLKLAARELSATQGLISSASKVMSMVRLGSGLQPMLTGRENIYVKCGEFGLKKEEIDTLFLEIIEFSGLSDEVDRQVRTYSDGMYARLEFAISTALPADVFLIDEVLSVSDIGFQRKSLERLNQLKRKGASILIVSHAENHIRQLADRCLCLIDGKALMLGHTESVYRAYYQEMGFSDESFLPLVHTIERPAGKALPVTIEAIKLEQLNGQEDSPATLVQGAGISIEVECFSDRTLDACPVVAFYSSSGLLLAGYDGSLNEGQIAFSPGVPRKIKVDLPYIGLCPGSYEIDFGLRAPDAPWSWVGYSANVSWIDIRQLSVRSHLGVTLLEGQVTVH